MKTALIRTLAIATLATSISAFAATDEPKHNDAATSASNQQAGCAERTAQGKKQKKATKPQSDEQINNEKEFDRVLRGIYG